MVCFIAVLSPLLTRRNNNTKQPLRQNSRSPQLVPYRESKLTMLLQPVLTGNGVGADTNVTMLISAYTGQKDMAEKVSEK